MNRLLHSDTICYKSHNQWPLDKKLQLISYTTQTEFLLNTNILENSSKISDTNEKSNILKTLLFPTDMGENFKMMILCDDIDTNFKLSFKDYRHKL